MQPNTPREHGLDTLRSLAILSVIGYHILAFHGEDTLPAILLPAVRIGWMGVDLFFVLSGYLIASQLFRTYAAGERPNFWHFYRNRLYRVLPVFWAVLALYYFVPTWAENRALAPVWEYLTFTFNLLVDLNRYHGFSHVWSLCVEEHFYLFLPLIVIVVMKKPSLPRAAILISSLVVFGIAIRALFFFRELRPLADQDGFGAAYMQHIYYATYSRLDGLLAGVTLAAIRAFRPRWWGALQRRGHALLVFGIVLVGLAVFLVEDNFPAMTGTSLSSVLFGFPLIDWGLGFVVASALCANGLQRFKVPGAKLCATLAYSLYLTHKEMIHLVDGWFPQFTQSGKYQWLAVYCFLCLLVAAVLYLGVERPFLLLRERRRRGIIRHVESNSQSALV